MLELLDYIVKGIVKNKDAVNIAEKQDGKVKVLTVTVDKADIGAIIGKSGNTAQAIRTVVKSMSSKERVVIKFNSND